MFYVRGTFPASLLVLGLRHFLIKDDSSHPEASPRPGTESLLARKRDCLRQSPEAQECTAIDDPYRIARDGLLLEGLPAEEADRTSPQTLGRGDTAWAAVITAQSAQSLSFSSSATS